MLSPEEIKAARQQYGLGTPAQATGSTFGSSTKPADHGARMARLRGLAAPQTQPEQSSTVGGGIGGFLGGAGKAIGEFGQGVAKGIMSVPQEAAALGSDIGMRAAAAVRPDATYEQLKAATQRGEGLAGQVAKGIEIGEEATKEQFAPKTTAEKAGFATEKIGEFFLPVGAASKARALSKIAGFTEKVAQSSPKLAKYAKSALSLGAKSATEALEMGARTALQEGKLDEKAASAAAIGGVIPFAGSALGLLKGQLPKFSRALEKTNLRLTPQQRRNFAKDVDDVSDYLAKNKVVGSADKRFQKISSKYETMEPELQNFFETTAKDRTVSKTQVLDDLEAIKSKYADRIDSDVIEGQVDKIKKMIEMKQPDQVPLKVINKLKRSAYDSAYSDANKVVDDVLHDVGDTLRKNVEQGAEGLTIGKKSIGDFNKEYGTLIKAKRLLKTAASRKDVGFLSKLVSSYVGGALGTAVGGPLGTAVGAAVGPAIAEKVAGTGVRSALAAGAETLGAAKAPAALAPLIKGAVSQGIQND